MAFGKFAAQTVKNCHCSVDPGCDDAMHEDQERMIIISWWRHDLLHASDERTAIFVREAWEETKNKQGYFYLPVGVARGAKIE